MKQSCILIILSSLFLFACSTKKKGATSSNDVRSINYSAKEKKIDKASKVLIKDYVAGKLERKIKTTASGLKYVVHEKGTGRKAKAGNIVSAHYSGFLTDGTPFDNSFKRKEYFAFPLGENRVIKGWEEGVALMREGDKFTFFIPSELAYGERGSPPLIKSNADLVYYVELHKVKK